MLHKGQNLASQENFFLRQTFCVVFYFKIASWTESEHMWQIFKKLNVSAYIQEIYK